jgi:hypothetical protein
MTSSTMPSAAEAHATKLGSDVASLAQQIEANGFVLVDAAAMRGLLETHASREGHGALDDEAAFVASWHDLPLDEHMADGGRYRRRRHAVFTAAGGELTREPDQPHYQSLRYNPLNGGVARWFAPVRPAVAEGPTLRAAIALLVSTADRLRPAVGRWHVEVHQFRIEALAGEAGKPTPEGTHRDGVDFVAVMLVGRSNVAQGVTTITDAAGAPLVRARLATPFEAMLLDDARVRHGVSPIGAIDPAQPASRDALVVTLRAAGG